jgi:hypothetical protein
MQITANMQTLATYQFHRKKNKKQKTKQKKNEKKTKINAN